MTARARTPWSVHATRLGVTIVHGVIDHAIVFTAVGWLNRRLHFLESVFLAYPATEDYALRYGSPRRIRKRLWRPVPTGVLRQGGKWILMVSIPATERELTDRANTERIAEMVARVERIRRLVEAPQKAFAGIVPGLLARRGIETTSPEGDMTARIVHRAVEQLRTERDYRSVVILGAAGFIGGRVMEGYAADAAVHGVDVKTGVGWPEDLAGPTLVVNIANRLALNGYADLLAVGDTVLNEVYPPPSGAQRSALAARGVGLVHLVGVEGKAYPSLPGAYGGAIPCCAAWEGEASEVVLRSM